MRNSSERTRSRPGTASWTTTNPAEATPLTAGLSRALCVTGSFRPQSRDAARIARAATRRADRRPGLEAAREEPPISDAPRRTREKMHTPLEPQLASRCQAPWARLSAPTRRVATGTRVRSAEFALPTCPPVLRCRERGRTPIGAPHPPQRARRHLSVLHPSHGVAERRRFYRSSS